MSLRLPARSRNEMLAAIARLVDAAPTPGTLSIYSGEQPSRAEEAVGDQLILAKLEFSRPAFGNPVNGSIGAAQIKTQPATKAGRATWARLADGAGNAVMDIDVGEIGAALNMRSAQLFEAGPVEISALVLRMPAS